MTMHGRINVLTVTTCGRCSKQDSQPGNHDNETPENWGRATLSVNNSRSISSQQWLLCFQCSCDVENFLRKPPSVEKKPSFTADPTYSYQWNKVEEASEELDIKREGD